MSYRRGIYGIEYNPPPEGPERSLVLRILGIAFLVALASLAVTVIRRIRADAPAFTAPAAEAVADSAVDPPPDGQTPPSLINATPTPIRQRPKVVRNLLMRLEAAEKARDVEMAATTIERLRMLPGAPAADLDDPLAKRLGDLNLRRLFEKKSARWVTEVTVRRGDSASRIAAEHGATLASVEKLNGDVSKLRAGSRLLVMNHPHFNLVVSRRTKTADLLLDGRFFRRYYLLDEVTGAVGAYPAPERLRSFWAEKGIVFRAEDRSELEMLLPRSTQITISEFQ